jgi:hypothetical protein
MKLAAIENRSLLLPALGVGIGSGFLFVIAGTVTLPWMIVIGVICLFLLASALVSPSIAFLMVVLVIPIERIGRFTEDTATFTISVMRIVGMVAMASLLLHGLLKKRSFVGGKSFFLYSGYLAFCLVSVFYSQESAESMRAFGVLAGNLLFLFLIINSVQSWRIAKLSVLVWLLVSVLVGIYTIYDWHFGTALERQRDIGTSQTRYSTTYSDQNEYNMGAVQRAVGPTSHPSMYGINLILTLPFFFFMLRVQKTILWQIAAWAGLAIVSYNILLTNTRASFAGALIALILCGVFKLYRISFIKLAFIGLLFGMLLPLLPKDIVLRSFTPSNYTIENSRTFAVRAKYWNTFLKVAKENWLWGIGVGEKATIAEALSTEDLTGDRTSVHNDFMASFLDAGVFGWFFYIGFLVSVIGTIWKTAMRCKPLSACTEAYWFLSASLVATLSTMFYGMQCDVFHFPLKGWWLVMGISMALARLSDEELAGSAWLPFSAPLPPAARDPYSPGSAR